MAVENMCFGSFTQDCIMRSGGFGCADQQDEPQNHLAATCFSCGLPLDIEHSVHCELEKQRMEMDWFLQMENQRLRSAIVGEGRRQRAMIMREYESKLKIVMVQKDEQLAAANDRLKELQNSLQVWEMEARAWKKKATEKEAYICHLRNRLNGPQQGEMVSSSSSSSSSQMRREEEPAAMMMMACKVCRSRSMCFVFFPCRHFCCCSYCETLLGHCPVCGTLKETSLEILVEVKQ
ncbi:hypothetical protein M569_04019 [Genlisea aurea]|uniref:RING-type domain-containing protein n=1 Tax=Genlisea aurea TaxID=192259 RepID=S8CTX8_9LAMI|nr:hypothetical protein M569_04019 [Genlisea aurea]